MRARRAEAAVRSGMAPATQAVALALAPARGNGPVDLKLDLPVDRSPVPAVAAVSPPILNFKNVCVMAPRILALT